MNISGEDADLHVSDEHIPGTLSNVLSSPPPTSKNEQEMTHRDAFSVSGVDQVGLSHMISCACGRAAQAAQEPSAALTHYIMQHVTAAAISETRSPQYDVVSNTRKNTIPRGREKHMLCVFSRYG